MSNLEKVLDRKYFDSEMKIYKTTCACLSPNHFISLTFDKDCINSDETEPIYSMFVEMNMEPKEYYRYGFWNGIWTRIKLAVKLLFYGEVEMEASFVFRDKEHILEFTNVIRKEMRL